MMTDRASLKELLASSEIVVSPGAYDVLSALLVERAGFDSIYLTGNGQGASALGLPDLGFITLTEMAARVRATAMRTTAALIVDADVGYGSLLSLRRAVEEFELAGASAIQIEDQVSPKKCGHELGREIVSTDEMCLRLRAAADARRSPDTLLIARTDARTIEGLESAIGRGQAYANAGADVIFVESPESEEEFAEIGRQIVAPKLANMVETGRSPYLGPQRLAELGFEMAIYPVTTVLAAMGAVRDALTALRSAGSYASTPRDSATLEEYHALLGFYEYQQMEIAYRSVGIAPALAGGSSAAQDEDVAHAE
jgi:2-methylisocitrate lyase-like PEP mutase family enzyme